MQLWRMDVDGGNPTHMVQEDANGWFPHVSPDGQWVAYVTWSDRDGGFLWKAPVPGTGGGAPQKLTEASYARISEPQR